MKFAKPQPFAEALAALDRKTTVPTGLSSADLAQLSPEIRERAFFSARTRSATYLGQGRAAVRTLVDGTSDLATQRLALKQALAAEGYQPRPDQRGTILDLSSARRRELVLRQNVGALQGAGRHAQGQTPAFLDAWPAQELVRDEVREIERPWQLRWRTAGGQLFPGGRMIARKDDPIWTAISRFGTPYPPFDFNSGMGVEDVSRTEAVALGIIGRDEDVLPQPRDLNEGLQATIPGTADDPEFRAQILASFGEKAGDYEFAGEVLRKKPAPTWESLGLESATAWRDLAPAPTLLPSAEGIAQLKAGTIAKDFAGRLVTFDRGVLDHWQGKSDVGQRAAHLPWALQTVRGPVEVWESSGQRLYVQAFARPEGKFRGCVVAVKDDGSVHTYFVTRLDDLDKVRKGRRVVRPGQGDVPA